MDKALTLAVRMFKDHVKPGPRAVVLLTSGPQDMNAWSAMEDPIRKLEKLGARIFVVSIGSNVPYSQIRRLVNSSNDIFQIPSFLGLQSEIHAIGRHISLTPGLSKASAFFGAILFYSSLLRIDRLTSYILFSHYRPCDITDYKPYNFLFVFS